MRGLLPMALLLAVGGVQPGAAQQVARADDNPPLSVIDWLDLKPSERAKPRPVALPRSLANEPPVATGVTTPDVTVRPLDGNAPRNVGLVPPSVTGLPVDLWAGSDVATLTALLDRLKPPDLPAAQALLYTVLLAETAAPQDGDQAQDQLALARVAKLVSLGALDPAVALIEQIGPTASPAHFELWMDISLLVGTEDRACAALAAARHLTDDFDRRIFCATRTGDFENAALLLGSAQALKLVPPPRLSLLDRFLNPDLYEEAAPLPLPREMDPLAFRLFEAIGEPLPTQTLPRQFAVADLRDLAGWKAQLEAAERLTRFGALPDNKLLGLYTDRQPAASGGIWDRVEALQRFETALRSRSPDAVSKTLPPLWQAMREARLEVAFANLFADQLAGLPLGKAAARAAFEMRLLSPGYEAAAAELPDDVHPAGATLIALARGSAPAQLPVDPVARAAATAFAKATPRDDLIAMARAGQLGAAILRTLALLQDGREGDPGALAAAIGTLRALGLEDTARRAAIQMILLERQG